MPSQNHTRAALVSIATLLAGVGVACGSSPSEDSAPASAGAPAVDVHVVYDPEHGQLPLPNDFARDASQNHLALPIASDLPAAEIELRQFLNTNDAWPTTLPLTARVTAPVDPATVTADTVLVYEWGAIPKRITDLRTWVDEGSKIVVDAPTLGWSRGAKYVVAVRGSAGVRDTQGHPVGPDRPFTFLRSREPVGGALEGLRVALLPFFDGLERQAPAIRREDIAALWGFTITTRTELEMDRAAQRMPIPFDALIDPKTRLVSLAPSAGDDAREVSLKAQLSADNGFGVGPRVDFALTTAVDPRTATPANVKVYEIDTARELRVVSVATLPTEGAAPCDAAMVPDNCRRIFVTLAEEEQPLRPATKYAVVVKRGLRASDGREVRPMLMGHFVDAQHALVDGGKSQVSALPFAEAERLEGVRVELAPLLAKIGRDDMLVAWPFTTIDAEPTLRADAKLPDQAGLDPKPTILRNAEITAGLIGLPSASEIGIFNGMFPGVLDDVIGAVYVPRVRGVRRVIEGTIASPSTLDPKTRARRKDGSWSKDDVRFIMTLPEKPASGKVPVVIFGHGLSTDRRFVLTISGKLAQKGFAAVSLDFPYHGTRTRCTQMSFIGIENPFPEAIRKLSSALQDNALSLPVCPSDATCNADGNCAKKDGTLTPLATIPLTDMPAAGGAALLDVDDIPHISDRLRQALIDLSALRRALRLADWASLTGGVELEKDRVFYSGQSLGGILGSTFVSTHDDIASAVLNVPGADLVGLFLETPGFKPQMKDFLEKEKLVDGSYVRARLMNMMSWGLDSVDPQGVTSSLAKRHAMIQRAGQDGVITLRSTERLHRPSQLPLTTYASAGHGDLVIPGRGDAMLDDLADFLAAAK